MSITAIGRAGYSYQDDVTVWLVVAWRERGLHRAVADSGLEDATFWLTVDAAPRQIEVQMKTEHGPVDENLFAFWLAHFPEHQTIGSLLEQLEQRADLSALFVVTANCAGAVAKLCVTEPGEALRPRAKPPVAQKDAKGILDAFAQAHSHGKPTPLGASRHVQCQAFAKRVGEAALCDIFRRVFVISLLNQPLVRERTARILSREFFVPQSRAHETANALAGIVMAENKTRRDVLPLLVESATRQGCELLLRPSELYVARPDEDALFSELNQRNVLLLTGLPNAGKTRLARALGSRLQRQGYRALEGSDVEQARRFLVEPGPEDRVYLLDDPLGQLIPAPEAPRALKLLRDLLTDVDHHRKLIVTSRIDVLRPLLGDPPDPIAGYAFHNVSLVDTELAATIWAQYAASKHVEADARARVDALLRGQSPGELLQPGQIRHLSLNVRQASDESAWLRAARYDGADIGNELCRDRAMREVLAALRCLASTTLAVYTSDLFFVLASDDELPGKDRTRSRAVVLGGHSNTMRPRFPAYTAPYQVSIEQHEALDELENRGLIEHINAAYRFTHPSYMAAAAQALRRRGAGNLESLRRTCTRALFCLRPANAAAAVAALIFLHAEASTERERSKAINLGGSSRIGFGFIWRTMPIMQSDAQRGTTKDLETGAAPR